MSGIMKISEATVLALHALIVIAAKENGMATNFQIAEFLHASDNHLSKVLQRLTRAGLVRSIRGPHGGFVLGRDPKDIQLREVYELFEGPLHQNHCLLETPVCGESCVFGDLLANMNKLFIDFMTRTTLSDAVEKVGKGMPVI